VEEGEAWAVLNEHTAAYSKMSDQRKSKKTAVDGQSCKRVRHGAGVDVTASSTKDARVTHATHETYVLQCICTRRAGQSTP